MVLFLLLLAVSLVAFQAGIAYAEFRDNGYGKSVKSAILAQAEESKNSINFLAGFK